MNSKGCALFIVLACWATTAGANEPSYRFSRSITTPALAEEELLAVAIDADVYAASETSLSDLRLLDGRGDAVPYLLRKVQTTREATVRSTWPSQQPAARPLEDGGLEIVVVLQEEDPQPNGLTLVSRLKDFEQRVRVFSSPAGEQWSPLGEEALIFDYSRFMDVRRDSVRFPETADRRFRIVIDDVTAEQESELLVLTRRLTGAEEAEREERVTIDRRPFRIERIDFWREAERERSAGDKKIEYPVGEIRVVQEPDEQQTLVVIEPGRVPLTSLKLQTTAKNFSRRAVVEVEQKRGVQSTWSAIGEHTLSRIDFRGLKQEELEVEFAESRQETYRLVIDNRDSPPLEVSGVAARGNEYEIVFLAAPSTSYQLVYGLPEAEAPQYDTAAIRQVLGEGFRPTPAELGAQTSRGGAAAFRWTGLLNNRPLLIGVIALLVVVLAWGLVRAAKRFEGMPSE
ncbi:MAG: DUF3999 family protein [Planctomycetales bacterium]|nr:DUF3999 family protein [Planctomycetales bacterium]